jgi:DNA-binding CsgD family transcriptional regulator
MSPEEDEGLRVVIHDWDRLTEMQKAICVALDRGQDTDGKIAAYLGISPAEVAANLRGVWSVLRDASTDKLWLK